MFDKIKNAKKSALDAITQGNQVADQPKEVRQTQYSEVMYKPQADGANSYNKLQKITNTPNYTHWYEKNGKKHPKGFEVEGILQLNQDKIKNNYNKYLQGEMGYQTFLMESYGYDIMENEGNHDFNNPLYWYKRYQNGNYTDVRKDAISLQSALVRAEKYHQENGVEEMIYGGRNVFDEYVSGLTATDTSMEEVFGQQWLDVKKQFDGDVEDALNSLRGVTDMNRFSEDGTKYIHSDGKIYDIVEKSDARASARNVAVVERNDDGSVDSVTINGNKLTGNILIDNVVGGTLGFILDLGKTVSQIGAGLLDVGEGVATGDWDFDKLTKTGLAFETARESNPFTAKAYIDMDGFEAGDIDDWQDIVGDLGGLILGMYATGGLGAGTMSLGKSMASGGTKAAKVLGKGIEKTGWLMYNMNNLHTGAWSGNVKGLTSGRAAFALTHATKDAMSVFSSRLIAGDSNDEAMRMAATTMGLNSAITFALGSGTKDDTYTFWQKVMKGKNNFLEVTPKITSKQFVNAAFKDKMWTGGLDFVDNFLTMSIANSVEQSGEIDINADFRTLLYSGIFAGNAYRGAGKKYKNTLPAGSFTKTMNATMKHLEDTRDSYNQGSEEWATLNVAIEQTKKDWNKMFTEYNPEKHTPDKQHMVVDFLEDLHNNFKDSDGTSLVSKTFKEVVTEDTIKFYKEIYEGSRQLNEKYMKQSGNVLFDIMNEGVVGYFKKLMSKHDVNEMEFLQSINQMFEDVGTFKYTSFEQMTGDMIKLLGGKEQDTGELKLNNYFKEVDKYDKDNNEYKVELDRGGVEQGETDYKTVERILNLMADNPEYAFIRRAPSTASEPAHGQYLVKASSVEGVSAMQTVYETLKYTKKLSTLTDTDEIKAIVEGLAKTHQRNFENDDDILNIIEMAVDLGYLSYGMANKIIDNYDIKKSFSPEALATPFGKAVKLMREIKDNHALKNYERVNDLIAEVTDDKVKNILNKIDPKFEDYLQAAKEGKQGNTPWWEKEYQVKNLFLPNQKETKEDVIEEKLKTELTKRIMSSKKGLLNVLDENTHIFRNGKSTLKEIYPILRDAKMMDADGNLEYKRNAKGKKLKTKYSKADIFKYLAEKHPQLFTEGKASELTINSFFNKAVEFHYGEKKLGDKIKYKAVSKTPKPNTVILDKQRVITKTMYKIYDAMETYFGSEDIMLRHSTLESFLAEKLNISQDKIPFLMEKEFQSLQRLYKQFGDEEFIYLNKNDLTVLENLGYNANEFTYGVSHYPGIINGDAKTQGIKVKVYKDRVASTTEEVEYNPVRKQLDPVITATSKLGGKIVLTNDTYIDGTFTRLMGDITDEQVDVVGYYDSNTIKFKMATAGGQAGEETLIAVPGRYFKVDKEEKLMNTDAIKAMVDVLASEDNPNNAVGLTKFSQINTSKNKLRKYWINVKEDGDDFLVSRLNREKVLKDIKNGKFRIGDMIPNLHPDYQEVGALNPLQAPFVKHVDYIIGHAIKGETNRQGNLFSTLNAIPDSGIKTHLAEMYNSGKLFGDVEYYTENLDEALPSGKVGDIIVALSNKENRTKTEDMFLKFLQKNTTEADTRERLLSDIDFLKWLREKDRTVPEAIEYLTNRKNEEGTIDVQRPLTSTMNEEVVAPISGVGLNPKHTYTEKELRNTLPTLVEEIAKDITETSIQRRVVSTPESKASTLIDEDGFIAFNRLLTADEETITALKDIVSKEDKTIIDYVLKEMKEIYSYDPRENRFLTIENKIKNASVNFPSIAENYRFSVHGTGEGSNLKRMFDMARNNLKYQKQKERYIDLFDRGAFNEAVRNSEVEGGPLLDTPMAIKHHANRIKYVSASKALGFSEEESNKAYRELVNNRAQYVFLDEKGNVIDELTAYGSKDNEMESNLFIQSKKEQFNNAKYIVAIDNVKPSIFDDFTFAIKDLDEEKIISNNKDINGKSYREFIEMKSNTKLFDWIERENKDVHEFMTLRQDEAQKVIDGTSDNLAHKKLYDDFIKLVNDYVNMHRSTKKKIEQIFINKLGDKAGKEINDVLNNSSPKYKEGAATNFDYAAALYIATGDENLTNYYGNDARLVNQYGNDVMEHIVNGVNPNSDKYNADLQYVANSIYDEVTKGIDDKTLNKVKKLVQKVLVKVNEDSKKEAEIRGLVESIKALEDIDEAIVRPLIVAEVLKQSQSGNKVRYLLTQNYTGRKLFGDSKRGTKLEYKDEYKLLTGKTAIVDFEIIPEDPDDLSNPNKAHLTSAAIKLIGKDAPKDDGTKYTFKQDGKMLEKHYNRTLKSMKKNGVDTDGFTTDYKESINAKEDGTIDFQDRIQRLYDEGYNIVAHNGDGFDFDLIREKFLFTEHDNGGTLIDSMNFFRDTYIKEGVIEIGSTVESWRQTIAPDLKESGHGALGDVRLLADIITRVHEEMEKGITIDNGKVLTEVNSVLRELGYKDLKAKELKQFDEIKKQLGVDKDIKVLFGLENSAETIVKLQRAKEARDHVVNSYLNYSRAKNLLDDKIINFKLTDKAKNIIETKGVNHLSKFANFLAQSIKVPNGKNKEDAINSKLDKLINYLTGGKNDVRIKDFTDKLIDPNTYNSELFNKLELDYQEYQSFNNRYNEANNLYLNKLSDEPLINRAMFDTAYANNQLFDDVLNILELSDNVMNNEDVINYISQRLQLDWTKDVDAEFNPQEELDLLPSKYTDGKFAEAFRLNYNEIIRSLGVGTKRKESQWSNATKMEFNVEFDIEGDGKRKLNANEIGIDKKTAKELFGEEYDPNNLYGWLLGSPSDTNASSMPVKYAVVEGKELGLGFVADENLLLALQRDTDGDKMVMHATKDDANKIAALKMLNEIMTKPFVTIRNKVHEVWKDGTTFELNRDTDDKFVKMILQAKELEGTPEEMARKYGLLDGLEEDKQKEQIKKVKEYYDPKKKLNPGNELELYFRNITHDQLGGMINKTINDEVLREIERYKNYSKGENDVLRHAGFRHAAMTDYTMNLLKGFGMTDEDISKLFYQTNLDLYRDVNSDDNNKNFHNLMDQVEDNPVWKASRKVAKKMNEIRNRLGLEDKNNFFFVKERGEVDVEGIMDFVTNKLNIDLSRDTTTNITTKTNFTNKRPMNILIAPAVGEDTMYLTPSGREAIEQSNVVPHARKKGFALSDNLSSKYYYKNTLVREMKDKLPDIMINRMVNGIYNISKDEYEQGMKDATKFQNLIDKEKVLKDEAISVYEDELSSFKEIEAEIEKEYQEEYQKGLKEGRKNQSSKLKAIEKRKEKFTKLHEEIGKLKTMEIRDELDEVDREHYYQNYLSQLQKVDNQIKDIKASMKTQIEKYARRKVKESKKNFGQLKKSIEDLRKEAGKHEDSWKRYRKIHDSIIKDVRILENLVNHEDVKGILTKTLDLVSKGEYQQARDVMDSSKLYEASKQMTRFYFYNHILEEIAMMQAIKEIGKETEDIGVVANKDETTKRYKEIRKALKVPNQTKDEYNHIGKEFILDFLMESETKNLNRNDDIKNKKQFLRVLQGTPLFTDGDEVVHSSTNGVIQDINDDGLIIRKTGDLDLIGPKATVEGLSAGKTTFSLLPEDPIDADGTPFDMVITSEGFAKLHKTHVDKIKGLEYMGEGTTMMPNGNTHKGIVVKGDTFFIENINTYDMDKPSGNTLVNSEGYTVDLMAKLSNIMTPFGAIEFKGEDLKFLADTMKAHKKQPFRQANVADVYANLRLQMMLASLNKEELNQVAKEFDYNRSSYLQIDKYLKVYENKIKSLVTKDQMIERLLGKFEGQEQHRKDKLKRTLEGLFDEDIELYNKVKVDGVYDDKVKEEGISSKGKELTPNKEFYAIATDTSRFDDDAMGFRIPLLKPMPYSKMMEQLGLYYDEYGSRELVLLGKKPVGDHVSSKVKDGFNTFVPSSVEYYNSQIKELIPEGNPKYGTGYDSKHREIIVPADNKLTIEKASRGTDERFDTDPKYRNTIREGRFNGNDRRKLTTKRIYDMALQMQKNRNTNSVKYAEALLHDRPITLNQEISSPYTSLNITKTLDGKITLGGVFNNAKTNVDLTRKNPVWNKGSKDIIDAQKIDKDVAAETFTPIEIVKVPAIKEEDISELQRNLVANFEEEDKALADEISIMGKLIDEHPDEGLPKLELTEGKEKKFFKIQRADYRRLSYGDNIEREYKTGLMSSSGFKKTDESAWRLDHYVGELVKNVTHMHGELRVGIARAFQQLEAAGPKAQEQFKMFYTFSKILTNHKMNEESGRETKIPTKTYNELKKMLGTDTFKETIETMRTFVDDYGRKNNRFVSTFYEAVQGIVNASYEAGIKAGEPLSNMYLIMFPTLAHKDDNTYQNQYLNKVKVAFNPNKYDNINEIEFMLNNDPFEAMDTLARDIAKVNAIHKFSPKLISEGIIDNAPMTNIAIEFADKLYAKMGEKKKLDLDKEVNKIINEFSFEVKDGHYLRKYYKVNIDNGLNPFTSVYKAMNDMILGKVEETQKKIPKEFHDLLHSVEDAHKIIKLTDDPLVENYVDKLITTYMFRNQVLPVLLKEESVEGFSDYVKDKMGSNFNLTDAFGRKIGRNGIKPKSAGSLEYVTKSLLYRNDYEFTLLLQALNGNVYRGNKSVTEHLDKHFYKAKQHSSFNKAMRKWGREGTRFIMGNPTKLLSRMERFTFTDTMMAMMANKKTPFNLARAKKELSQSLSSNGKATTDMLKLYQEQRGSINAADKYFDWFNKTEVRGDKGLKKRGVVGAVLDSTTDQLSLQHDLVRYALFLTTMEEIDKHGEIKHWGAAYPHKDAINSLGTNAEKAFAVVRMNIATFQDMPFLLRYTSPWLIFTSYLAGQTRWIGEWGLTMLRAGQKAARKEDMKGALTHLMTPMVAGLGMYGIGNMIYNIVSDIFGVDDETLEEWKEDRKYIEFFSTLFNGSPVAHSTPGMPFEALYGDYVETIKKGFKEKGMLGIPEAFFNKQILSRANPLLKIPLESKTGELYFNEFPIDDKYHTTFIENFLRKATGMFIGHQTINAMIDNDRLAQYRDDEKGMFYDIMRGMRNSIAAEFGNTKAYKRGVKDFYKARSLIYNEMYREDKVENTKTVEGIIEPLNYRYNNSNYDSVKAGELTDLFRTAMKRGEPVSTIYSIINDELQNGTDISTVHSAMNKISVSRILNKLDNKDEFLMNLTDKEYRTIQNGIAFETEMFPGISNIDLYELTGSNNNYYNNYIPYNPHSYMPYKPYEYKPYEYEREDRIYDNMGTYNPRYKSESMYERWNK